MAKKFEDAMKELEEIVVKLENGDATLEEALSYFESGIKLAKSCRNMLDLAERKVSVLLADADGERVKENFIDEEE